MAHEKTLSWLLGAALAASLAPAARADAGPACDLGGLAWMAGSWRGASGGVEAEEQWLAPRGGLMLGVHRDVTAAGRASFEFMRIECGPRGPVYQASPGGRPAVPFELARSGPLRAEFANPRHDFPQRISYWREGDVLHARVEGPPDQPGQAQEWSWQRVP